jgi:type VI protein secretion system component Hcp
MSIFLQIPNIPGESLHAGYIGQFKVMSMSWSGSNNYVTGAGASSTTGFSTLSISKLATVSCPIFLFLMANPTSLGSIVVTVGSDEYERFFPRQIYTLTSTLLTGYTQSSSGEIPVEDLTFDFLGISYQQNVYDNQGNLNSIETHYWDTYANNGG